MTTAIHTTDIDDRFFPELRMVARDLGADSLDILKVIYAESGAYATAYNPNGGASGLLQFMPATLQNLGWTGTTATFRRLTATEQLAFVRRYLQPYRGKLSTVAAVYVATFLPSLLAHAGDLDYVLVAKGGQLGWAYTANAGLDANGDYAITVRELEQAVDRQAHGARWDEIVARLDGRFRAFLDLRATADIQRALTALGFGPGPVDGIVGPRTRAAVVDFQKSHGLVPDGIVGPNTRGALRIALKAIGIDAVGG